METRALRVPMTKLITLVMTHIPQSMSPKTTKVAALRMMMELTMRQVTLTVMQAGPLTQQLHVVRNVGQNVAAILHMHQQVEKMTRNLVPLHRAAAHRAAAQLRANSARMLVRSFRAPTSSGDMPASQRRRMGGKSHAESIACARSSGL